MSKQINIGGRLHSTEQGNVITGANEVLDDTKGKKQNVINADVDAELLRLYQSKQNNLTFDNTPTEESDNPVKSGGVYAADKALSNAIDAILILIPSAATALNQLADKNFVNSSIATDTATFRGTSETGLSEAQFLEWANGLTHDMNDYVFWQTIDEAGNTLFKRYKWNGTQWLYEYTLNNSSFTADQWAAITSGITTALVEKLVGLPTNTALQQALNSKQDALTFDNAPTEGSNNPVKSGGVYSAVKAEKEARLNLAQTVSEIGGDVSQIEDVIPAGATAQNQLVANASMEAYVASIIQNITASFTLSTTDGHINLTLTQVNGRVVTLTLASSDIASAQALTALTGRVTTAEGNITSLTGRVSTNEIDIANLQQLYNNLQQSKPVPVTALPETGQQQGVIYRLAGTTSYSDYMWNGSTWVLMATYNNAIDLRPKKASQNLVTSGGVFDNMGALDVSELNATENPHTLAKYVDLSAALAAIPTDYQKGGMSIKFVQSSDNKYVQYRYMSTETTGTPNPFLDTANWINIENETSQLQKEVGILRKSFNISSGENPLIFDNLNIKVGEQIYIKLTGTTEASRLIIRANAAKGSDAITIKDYAQLDEEYKWIATDNVTKLYLWNNGSSSLEITLSIGLYSATKNIYDVLENTPSKTELRQISTKLGGYTSSGDVAEPYESVNYKCALVYANVGDTFIVKGKGTSVLRLWFTCDENNVIIRRAAIQEENWNGIEITIQEGERKIGFNSINDNRALFLYTGLIQDEISGHVTNIINNIVPSISVADFIFKTSFVATNASWKWINVNFKAGDIFTIAIKSNLQWTRLIIAINETLSRRYIDLSETNNSYSSLLRANEDITTIGIFISCSEPNILNVSINSEVLSNIHRNAIGYNDIRFPAIRMKKANKNMAAFCFVFDDGDVKDDDVVALFDEYNAKCGFALIGSDYNILNPSVGRGAKYLNYQNNGYSCLNHNSSGDPLSSYPTEAEAAAAISASINLFEKLGIVINGWVCPNNVYVDSYRNLLGSFHAYAFGDHGNGEGTQVYDVNTRAEDILRLRRYDIQNPDDIVTIKSVIDSACENGYMVCFYGHAARIGLEGYYTMDKIEEIIEYIISKRDAGRCFFSSPDEVVKYYFDI